MQAQHKDEKPEIYHIETAGPATTRIGGKWIEPLTIPTEFTKTEYEANLKTIKHYVDRGVIIVHIPGAPGNAIAAQKIRQIRAEQEIEAAKAVVPPPSQAISLSGGAEYARAVAQSQQNFASVPLFSKPDGPEPDAVVPTVAETATPCIAITGSGKRCKLDALMGDEAVLVCKLHLNMLVKKKDLRDPGGRRINETGNGYVKLE